MLLCGKNYKNKLWNKYRKLKILIFKVLVEVYKTNSKRHQTHVSCVKCELLAYQSIWMPIVYLKIFMQCISLIYCLFIHTSEFKQRWFFLLWNALFSFSGSNTRLKNTSQRDFCIAKEIKVLMTLKNCLMCSEWRPNGQKMSTLIIIHVRVRKMIMCERRYLGYFPFPRFHLHLVHRYVYFFFIKNRPNVKH